MKMVKNAAGRMVPTEINGEKVIPFMGVGKHRPTGKKYAPTIATAIDYPRDSDKRVPNLKEALIRSNLKDGSVISTHHHLRNGDLIANQIFDIAAELGVKDLVWAPSAAFPCHKEVIKHLESGVIHHIEGSMNGPLGIFTSEGKMRGMAVLRSHGGRVQAIQDGELKIDIAVLAAPTADFFGNGHGLDGPSACGGLGYSLVDYKNAEKVVVVTDNLIKFPCMPMHIEGNYVDYVVEMDRIGIPELIVSGTTQITKSPDRLLIAELTARFCDAAGLVKDGFSFQMGAGGTSLAIGRYFHEMLKKRNISARFAVGGSTQYSAKMLEDGCLDYMLDAQTFDLEAVRSMRENTQKHSNISIFHSYDYHAKGNFTTMMDIMILGATEVDVNYNGNVVTHSDGYLMHGIGGWQNCLFAKCTILPVPLFRNRIPIICDEVTTLVGPGELIDVIVTERGIAINPNRQDLIDNVKDAGLPLKTIEELKEEAERICGKPQKPVLGEKVVAAIKWVDGTVIDVVREVKT